MQKQSLTEQLITWLWQWREPGFPHTTQQRARGFVLDWLGSALAGQATPPGKILLDYAAQQPNGRCQIIGTGQQKSTQTAALVNGALSHIVEMDDLDRDSVVHPGAVVIPAALALADQLGTENHDLLNAIIAGYEVALRIGTAVGKQHYYHFHNTATCGIFGAATAAGWLLGLTVEQMVWALGNAGTQAAGLWQFNADGDMSKHLHAGHAAAAGLLAAQIAAGGFTGARHILEGERGFFAGLAPDADRSKVIANMVTAPTFKISGVSIKPHASCRHTHPAIDAALALRPQIGKRSIEQVQIDTYQAAIDLCDNPTPQTIYAAKFSLQYCVVVALLRGIADLEAFDAGMLENTATSTALSTGIASLLPKVQITLDPEFDNQYPTQWPARVSISLQDGTILNQTIHHPKGDPENPLSNQELEAKFRQLAAYGDYEDQCDYWLTWVNIL